MKKLLPVGATILFWGVAYGVVFGCVARVYAAMSGMTEARLETLDRPTLFLVSLGISFCAFAIISVLRVTRDRIIGKAR